MKGVKRMPLEETGYKRPTYEDLLAKYSERARGLFGDDIDLLETSTIGKLIRILAYKDADIYEDIENVYYSAFPHSARGHSLDRLMPFAGITRNAATYARRKIRIRGETGYNIEVGTVVSADGVDFVIDTDVVIGDSGTVEVICVCDEAGTVGNKVVVDSLQEQVVEIEKIEDLGLVEAGKEVETDTASRQRFDQSISGGGSGTIPAIRASIMRVDQVESVVVIENKSEAELDGIPPRGFKCYVLAPESQDQLIAEAIFDKKPVGIPCVGDVSVEVLDEGGIAHTIRFSHSKEVRVYARICVKTNVYFEENGIEQIKINLNEYVYGLSNGESIILSALYGKIHAVSGVTETISLELSSNGTDYMTNNISVLDYEIARLNVDDIEVIIDDTRD